MPACPLLGHWVAVLVMVLVLVLVVLVLLLLMFGTGGTCGVCDAGGARDHGMPAEDRCLK